MRFVVPAADVRVRLALHGRHLQRVWATTSQELAQSTDDVNLTLTVPRLAEYEAVVVEWV